MSNVAEIKTKAIVNLDPVDYQEMPVFTTEDYQARVKALLELAGEKGYTHLVVYGDREHFSNVHFLTGYDPRFEETLLILSHDDLPVLLVGNEGMGYAGISPLPLRLALFQSFSLVGQPRGESGKLEEIFAAAGINGQAQIGVIGWKSFRQIEREDYQHCSEIPSYIIETLAALAKRENICNANDLMIDNDYGLRIRLDLKELVRMELAGTMASRKVWDTIRLLQAGMSEMEASQALHLDGYPLSTHPNINFGAENLAMGLASPGFSRRLAVGDPVGVGFGYWGALVHKAGLYVKTAAEIPAALRQTAMPFFHKYFESVVAWYEAVRIGVPGGEVFHEVQKVLGDLERFGITLNPGHLIHTDEWTNSPFFEGAAHPLASGMAIQCDFFAALHEPYLGAHVEDGIFLADREMRAKLEASYPGVWQRIARRREFMQNILGIRIAAEVMPASDLPGVFFPYMADPEVILAMK